MSWSNLFLYSHAILQTWNEKSIVFSSSICKIDRGKGTANSCCQYIMYIFLQFQLGVWFQHTTILILLYMPCYYLHLKQRITCSIIGSVVLYDGSVIEVKLNLSWGNRAKLKSIISIWGELIAETSPQDIFDRYTSLTTVFGK